MASEFPTRDRILSESDSNSTRLPISWNWGIALVHIGEKENAIAAIESQTPKVSEISQTNTHRNPVGAIQGNQLTPCSNPILNIL
ncbi:hypothetical protein [Coleofasciculus sp.]|uniref:hypothetical protein n=1 Tax=Coleofasciculus sp. TaxID=3100458 RepID=UPI003A4C2D35